VKGGRVVAAGRDLRERHRQRGRQLPLSLLELVPLVLVGALELLRGQLALLQHLAIALERRRVRLRELEEELLRQGVVLQGLLVDRPPQ
jgi:hypothetical protein